MPAVFAGVYSRHLLLVQSVIFLKEPRPPCHTQGHGAVAVMAGSSVSAGVLLIWKDEKKDR